MVSDESRFGAILKKLRRNTTVCLCNDLGFCRHKQVRLCSMVCLSYGAEMACERFVEVPFAWS